MKPFIKRPVAWVFIPLIVFPAYLFLAGAVDNRITTEYPIAIERLETQAACRNLSGFDAGIACISLILGAPRKLV
jgi:hypothetical protein